MADEKLIDIQPVEVKPGKFLRNKYFFTVQFTFEKADGKTRKQTRQIPKGYARAWIANKKMFEFVKNTREQILN